MSIVERSKLLSPRLSCVTALQDNEQQKIAERRAKRRTVAVTDSQVLGNITCDFQLISCYACILNAVRAIVVCFCDYVFTVMGVPCLGLKESLRTIFESLALALKV